MSAVVPGTVDTLSLHFVNDSFQDIVINDSGDGETRTGISEAGQFVITRIEFAIAAIRSAIDLSDETRPFENSFQPGAPFHSL